ncbi:MAG: ABC transporter substrate-binding protein, partial [Gaiellaceae bacterium]
MNVVLLALLIALFAVVCGGDDSSDMAGAHPPATTGSWDELVESAQGQTVRWWLWGGDDRVNAYIDDVVAPAARERGIDVERVPIDDTADAVQRVVAEVRAGEESGAVDLIWINGENFAAGKEGDLWLNDWVAGLPNTRYVDLEDPSIALDFQVPTDGQEAPWSRAAFIFAYDSERVAEPPQTFDQLLAWAKENPGRFTYPAPPDFTGSAFVRTVIQRLGSREAAWELLRELRPLQHRNGEALPENEAELNELFANGEVDIAMSYDPGFVQGAVTRGQFPKTARPLLIGGGALVNASYVVIPKNAANAEAAPVLADVLLDP